jgi:hypothetical protein
MRLSYISQVYIYICTHTYINTNTDLYTPIFMCIGGSVQQTSLSQEAKGNEKGTASFNMIMERLEDDTMMLVLPIVVEEKAKSPIELLDDEVSQPSTTRVHIFIYLYLNIYIYFWLSLYVYVFYVPM